MEADDAEERPAAPPAWQPKRDPERRSTGMWWRNLIAAAFAIVGFAWGAHAYYGYHAGTPTTATVTQPGGGRGASTKGTWSLNGELQTGDIETGRLFGAPSVGSTIDVRVRGGTAYTASACLPGFGLGVLIAGPAIGALVVWSYRKRAARADWD
ncbi:hypothetical protein AWB90_14880 [Mycobacterium paraense]|uniref:DUF3592 domain-containing protein n=1 Tax=Mycobacterium paraense TaxID=767916 RepID=A0A1X2A930_9MYCO|nr:hypothetical protein [Mycobacterium paraense]ORW45485.1 hypothetical protein AWB90_14880 [Mycobacterium paraense]